ncbi:leucine-rich repeat-containing protein egg-6-like [Ornithodoros turicata]|uniref:leucine-rich repeat-containing protein egg-6-like n=1 Tax=Ornithodoros turicata TaxID=34597 RepID=UPI003138D43F
MSFICCLFMLWLCVSLLTPTSASCQRPCVDLAPQGCFTTPDFEGIRMICRGFQTSNDLINSAKRTAIGQLVTTFELHRFTAIMLPNEVFQEISQAQEVVLKKVDVSALAAPDGAEGVSFRSLNVSLKELTIVNCNLLFQWKWHLLGTFTNLYSIAVRDSSLYRIGESLFDIFAPELRELLIDNGKVFWYGAAAFKMLVHLRRMCIRKNVLSAISRNLFPITAEELEFVDLSYNNILLVEEGTFHGMPRLRFLDLSNNLLKSLPVGGCWTSLEEIWLDGNSFNCASLCWMKTQCSFPVTARVTTCERDMYLSEYCCPPAISTY